MLKRFRRSSLLRARTVIAWAAMTKQVFVLGAGFSKAASERVAEADRLPLLWELRPLVETWLRANKLPDPPFPADRFPMVGGTDVDVERWLSFLAQPPPWVGPADSKRCHAAFLDMSLAIASVIRNQQQHVLDVPPVDWLPKLVEKWNGAQPGCWEDPKDGDKLLPGAPEEKTTVITFNYDTLPERAYVHAAPSGRGVPATSAADLLVAPLMPVEARGLGIVTGRGFAGFQLLKLHGSIDWYYSGAEASPDDTVFHNRFQTTWNGTDLLETRQYRNLIADKVPFLVPPTAVKTTAYRNATLRAQWAEAAVALSSAEDLVLMGFSLPPTDSVVLDMIEMHFDRGRDVFVVDCSPDLPSKIDKLLPDRRVHGCYAGVADPIQQWLNHDGLCRC